MQYAISSATFVGKTQYQKYSIYLQLLAFNHMSFCLGLTDSSSEKNRYLNTSSMMLNLTFKVKKSQAVSLIANTLKFEFPVCFVT